MFDQEDKDRISSNMRTLTSRSLPVLNAIPVIVMRSDMDDADALANSALFPEWAIGFSYKIDDVFRYDGELYRVAQNHTSQSQWVPGSVGTESLYTHITIDPETGYEEWKQPLGAHDAYSYGDIVRHNDKLWISTVAGEKTNVWEPGVYGWDEYVES